MSETLGLIDVLMTANGGSLDEFAAKIGQIYPKVEKYGVESASYYINDRLNRYAQAAPYNYVSYDMVGGFFSDAQRRFVMASLEDGSISIPYDRSGADHYETVGSGADMKVESVDTSMYYSMHDEGQTRMQMLRGWDKVGDLLMGWSAEIVKSFELGVTDAIYQLEKEGLEFSEEMTHTAP